MKAKNAIYVCNDKLFDKWTEQSAYLLGYLEADGYIKIDGPAIRIAFATSGRDISFLKQLKQATGWTGSIGISKVKVKGKKYNMARFTISSRDWKSSLLTEHYRKNKIPPIPKHLVHHYIRGYFDGDGSVFFERQSMRNKSNFVFSSPQLAEDFKRTLEEYGIKSSNVHLKTSSSRCWYFNISYLQTEKLREFMYKGGTLYMNRKFQTFLGNYEIAD